MTDIVEQLRARECTSALDAHLLGEAADEIERLRAALTPFAAIEEIDDARFNDGHPIMIALNGSWVYDEKECNMALGDFRRARAALGPESERHSKRS